MIRFKCGQCGRELVVTDTHAGRKGKCPQCGHVLHIPQAGETPAASTTVHPDGLVGTKDDLFLALPRAASKSVDKTDRGVPSGEDVQGVSAVAEAEDDGGEVDSIEEPAGWADALLYPANLDGLVQIGILTFAFWAVGVLGFFLAPFLRQYSGLLVLILRVILTGYTVFYLSYCIFDSSRGGRRAATISLAHTPDLWDLLSQLLLLLASAAVSFSPAAVYYIATERADAWFWVLAVSGASFFPMALLTATLFDGIDALNPILMVRSILVTLPAYLVLLVKLGVVAFLLAAAHWASRRLPVPRPFWNAACLYLLLIGCHLLGRFYHRRKDALDWGL